MMVQKIFYFCLYDLTYLIFLLKMRINFNQSFYFQFEIEFDVIAENEIFI